MRERRAWSAEEDAALREASARRAAFKELMEALGRKPASIRARARILGVGVGTRRTYSAEEEQRIRFLAARGKHYHEIAETLGFGVDNVKNWCLRHGIKVKPMNQPWTIAEKQLVGITVKDAVDQLAAQLNRTPRSILHQFLRAGMFYTKIQRPIRKTRPKAA